MRRRPAARQRARNALLAALVFWQAAPLAAQQTTHPGENVARGRPYSLTPPPNYGTALGPAGSELTDGKVGAENFWIKGGAVGWTWRGAVMMRLPLAHPVAIDRVRLHTGRRERSEIHYPAQAHVFVGDGKGRYEHVGDAAGSDPANRRGPFEVRFFEARFETRTAAEVVLVLHPRGAFVFVDEVEVIAAGADGRFEGRLSLADLLPEARRLRRRFALEKGDQLPAGPDPARRWAMPLAAAELQSTAGTRIGPCAVAPIEPWDDQVTRGGKPPAYRLREHQRAVTVVGGRDYVAWRIVNLGDRPVEVSLRSPDSGGGQPIAFAALAHVQALDYAWVADVSVPFERGELAARSTMVVTAEVPGDSPGRRERPVEIGCGEARGTAVVTATVIDVPTRIRPLHGTVWSYLQLPVTDALACAPDIHARIGATSLVVHPDALIDSDGKRPERELRRYFRAYRADPRVLLYLDIKTRPWPFLGQGDEQWVAYLAEWWAWVARLAREERIEGELILYPIDEIHAEDIGGLERFRAAMARVAPGVRIYGTIFRADASRALASLDIVQAHDTPAMIDVALAAGRPELHLYATKGDGKLLPAHGYYRLQGWRAYLQGFAGVGFWALSDSAGEAEPETGWSGFGGSDRDFGTLYAAPGGCAWPSRRLLAWRRGIEEHRILRYCESRLGAAAVRQIAREAVARATAGETTADLESLAERCLP
jgi:hypothetical protein